MLYSMSDLYSISSDVYSKMWWPLRNLTTKQKDTCDRWKTLAFKLNVDSLCVGQMSGFSQFIPNMSNYTDQVEQLSTIKSNIQQLTSINHIYIMSLDLTKAQIECIQEILSRVEVIQLQDCRFEGDFFGSFLQFCYKLRRLYVQNIDLERYEFETDELALEANEAQEKRQWLHQEYPLLEHFEFTPQNGGQVDDLKVFFEQNPSVRSFSTNSLCLYESWRSLIDVKANLDYLIVDFNCWPRIFLDSICDALNYLQAHRFYKRLHLYVPHLQLTSMDDTVSLIALEKLYVKRLNQMFGVALFKNVKELGIFEIAKDTDMIAIAKALPNLERVYLKTASSDDVLAFIRHSPKLNQIKVENLEPGTHLYGRIIDLSAFNKERAKLNGGRKVKYFVSKNMHSMSKLRNKSSKFNLIKLKKIDLNEISEKFDFLTSHIDFVCLEHFALETMEIDGHDYL